MNPLTEMYEQLAVSLTADPLLLLASAVAAFDPFWADFDDTDIDYETDPLTIALQVTRGAFPDIYAEAVERLQAGAPYAEMDRLLCQAISAKGIPLNDLDTIGWGIPMTAIGIDLEDPEFYAVHGDLSAVLAPFGIVFPEAEVYSIEVLEGVYAVGRLIAHDLNEQAEPLLRQVGWAFGWLFACTGNSLILCGIDGAKSSNRSTSREIRIPEQAYTAGRILAEDLATHTDARYRQVSWLLKWLFSCSGNSCVDWDDEMMSSMEPLSWSPEDIAFAIEMIQEADGIMADALAGSRWLLSEPALLLALWQNVRFLYKQLKKYPRREPRLHLEWPDPDDLPTLSPPLCPLTGQECQWVKSG